MLVIVLYAKTVYTHRGVMSLVLSHLKQLLVKIQICSFIVIKTVFQQDIQKVWGTVTSLNNYAWRSDLSKIEI